MNTDEVRLFGMLAGWVMAFYGVCRRDWAGTLTTLAGLGLTAAAMAFGQAERRLGPSVHKFEHFVTD